MSEKRSKQQRAQAKLDERSEAADKPAKRWPIQQAIILVVGIVLGFALRGVFVGTDTNDPPQATVEQTPSVTETPESDATTDAYGRSPDHPHYGHAHP